VRTRLRKRAGRLRTTLPEARSARATVDRCGAPLEQTRSRSRARRRPRRRVPCRHGRSGPLPAPGRGGVLTSRRAPLATSNVQGLRRPRLQPRREHAGLAEEPQMTLLDLLEVLAGDHTEGQPDELDELLAEGRERAYLTTQSLNEARTIRVPVHVVDRMNVCDTCKSRVALGRRTQQRLRRGDRGRDHDAVWPHPRRDRGDDDRAGHAHEAARRLRDTPYRHGRRWPCSQTPRLRGRSLRRHTTERSPLADRSQPARCEPNRGVTDATFRLRDDPATRRRKPAILVFAARARPAHSGRARSERRAAPPANRGRGCC